MAALLKRLVTLCLLFAPSFAQPTLPDHDIVVFDLARSERGYEIGNPRVISDAPGYDNQPSFSANSEVVFFTRIEAANADIWCWTPNTKARRLASSPLSEYSPTPMPGSKALSTVRVEADQSQRLWRYSADTGFEVLFPTIKPVGYHAWSGHNLALFVLGEPHQLQVTELGRNEAKVVDSDIGRCLQKVPGFDAISYTVVEEGRHRLKIYDFATGNSRSLGLLPAKSQDYVWLNSERLLSSDGESLMISSPAGKWAPLPCPISLNEVSRLALSPDGKLLAVVIVKQPPSTQK